MQVMRQYADILAFDKNGQLALIAEVKSKRGTSMSWAARMRRNMYAHGYLPDAPYFLLALPDVFYLWDNSRRSLVEVAPNRKVDPHPFLEPYYESTGVSPTGVTERSFGFIVTSWLNQVLHAKSPQEVLIDNQSWLVESGLFDRLAGGHLELEVAA